jgi:3',5'-cyclic-AMP phosphodiesterase
MTAILQISDTHIVPEGRLVSGRLDTAKSLAKLVARITSLRAQIGPIDALLISGDLTDEGSAESYERIKALLAPLALPLLVIPGNHDAREPMRAAFAGAFPQTGALNWVQKVGDLTVIGLDTLVEGSGKGSLTPQTLTFLKNALAEAGTAPVVIALHHPPFACGIAFMDAIGLTNRAAFAEAVTGYKGALRILCGHIHSFMVVDVAGHSALSAPSPCSTFAFDLRPTAPVGFMGQEGGCLLHRWTPGGFHSIHIPDTAGPGPFPF